MNNEQGSLHLLYHTFKFTSPSLRDIETLLAVQASNYWRDLRLSGFVINFTATRIKEAK